MSIELLFCRISKTESIISDALFDAVIRESPLINIITSRLWHNASIMDTRGLSEQISEASFQRRCATAHDRVPPGGTTARELIVSRNFQHLADDNFQNKCTSRPVRIGRSGSTVKNIIVGRSVFQETPETTYATITLETPAGTTPCACVSIGQLLLNSNRHGPRRSNYE